MGVQDFVGRIFGKPAGEGTVAFYRGHSNADRYRLQPAVFRSADERAAEPSMFRELLIAAPADFREDQSTFDKLVRMQHYSLPTRLLDISANPLIALYFACRSATPGEGEVIRFTIREEDVLFFDSDTASCIANLAQLSDHDKRAIDFAQPLDAFNRQIPIQKLLHFIGGEKPYFRPIIKPGDLRRVVCVRGRHSNNRIVSQSGAFLLFGLDAVLPETGNADIHVERFAVRGGEKVEILGELDALAINESTVFPYIETAARYIAVKHRSNRTPLAPQLLPEDYM